MEACKVYNTQAPLLAVVQSKQGGAGFCLEEEQKQATCCSNKFDGSSVCNLLVFEVVLVFLDAESKHQGWQSNLSATIPHHNEARKLTFIEKGAYSTLTNIDALLVFLSQESRGKA